MCKTIPLSCHKKICKRNNQLHKQKIFYFYCGKLLAMVSYSDKEVKKWSWIKHQSYIPSSDALGNGSAANRKLIEKFPIENINHNPNNYPNPISIQQVLEMLDEFYPFGFIPIRINEDGNLLDGQHRLKFALMCGLKYVDVWVDNNVNS